MLFSQISEALVKLLRSGMSDILPKPEQIGIVMPYDPDDVLLGLYLFSVRTCTDVNPPSIISKGRSVEKLPPRMFTLYYLITAYSKVDAQYRAAEDQRLLTYAMSILENMPVLTKDNLGFMPGESVDMLQLQFVDIGHESMARIWEFRDVPYRLSVVYRVCPVELPRGSGRLITRVSDTGFSGDQI